MSSSSLAAPVTKLCTNASCRCHEGPPSRDFRDQGEFCLFCGCFWEAPLGAFTGVLFAFLTLAVIAGVVVLLVQVGKVLL